MIRLFALCVYALFGGVFVYFIGFVTGIAVPKAIDDGVAASAPLAVAIDVGLVLFFAAVVLLINLAIDVLYGWLDPRVRYA